jgi:hypothetical protein
MKRLSSTSDTACSANGKVERVEEDVNKILWSHRAINNFYWKWMCEESHSG